MRPTLALLLLLGIGLGTTSAAGEPDTSDPFAGKVVVLLLEKDGPAYPLKDAKIQNLGGQAFIVGVGGAMGPSGHWLTGTKVRFAINRVFMMAEFTPAEFEKYRAASNSRGAGGPGPATP